MILQGIIKYDTRELKFKVYLNNYIPTISFLYDNIEISAEEFLHNYINANQFVKQIDDYITSNMFYNHIEDVINLTSNLNLYKTHFKKLEIQFFNCNQNIAKVNELIYNVKLVDGREIVDIDAIIIAKVFDKATNMYDITKYKCKNFITLENISRFELIHTLFYINKVVDYSKLDLEIICLDSIYNYKHISKSNTINNLKALNYYNFDGELFSFNKEITKEQDLVKLENYSKLTNSKLAQKLVDIHNNYNLDEYNKILF